MGYYIRILGTTDTNVSIDEISAAIKKKKLRASLSIDETENNQSWSVLTILNRNGDDLAQIEKNSVVEGELGKAELDEFRESIAECKPTSAAKWLDQYFNRVKVIFAFQLLNNAFENENYPIIDTVKNAIFNKVGGILQADGEGFSNEDGYHILWQFSYNVTGDWCCAVLSEGNEWERFKMDLGDIEQRREFWSGKVPSSAIRL